MSGAYCSTCGNAMGYSDQFCGTCGTPGGNSASSVDATRTDLYSPYQYPQNPAPGPAPYPYVAEPTSPMPPPGPTPPRKGYSPAVLVAAVALAVAVIAVAVTLIVANSGNDQSPVAAGTSAGTSTATSATPSASTPAATSAPAGSPTLTQPQIVTVTRSATLTAPNQPADGGSQPAPLSTEQLRSAFESGVPVDSSPYEDADSDVVFTSPSGNIECYLVGDGGVQCAIKQYDFPQPGPDCDNGAIVTIDEYGHATYSGCVTRPFTPSGNTLAYSSSISSGGFGCVSQKAGISCVDFDTDTGFTLSRQEFVPVN